MDEHEMGQLIGGPHDGIRFPVERSFWYQAPDQLPEPAQRVYASPEGRLSFWFSGSVMSPPGLFGPCPPLSRYDLTPDDSGWVCACVTGRSALPSPPIAFEPVGYGPPLNLRR